MLDTNICIYLIKNNPLEVIAQLKRHNLGEVGVSSISAAELAYGVAKSGSERNRAALERFLLPLEIAPFDEKAAWSYGNLRANLERAGTPIGPLDMQIAAHALSIGCALVTNNVREFERVPTLQVENWAK